MALPTTIFNDVGLPGHHPPYISSVGATYSVIRADPNELDVKKATDPEDSWTLKDSASGPVHVGTLLGYSTYQDGDIIHIVAWSEGTYEYYTFDMSTDAWVLDELIETPDDAPAFPWASIAVRSDGGVRVGYAGDQVRVQGKFKERVYLARRDGGTWTTGIALDEGGNTHYGNPNCELGTNDGTHFVWQRQTDTAANPPTTWKDTQGRTLNSSNSLSAVDTNTGHTSGRLLGWPHLIPIWDDSGTDRIAFVSVAPTGNDLRIIRGVEDGSNNLNLEPGPNDEILTAGLFLAVGEEWVPLSMIQLDGDYHVLYSGGDTTGLDKDLYHIKSTDLGVTWDTETEEIDAVDINFISANVYVRDLNTVMAIVYDDGGVQKYYERVLIAGQTHQMML